MPVIVEEAEENRVTNHNPEEQPHLAAMSDQQLSDMLLGPAATADASLSFPPLGNRNDCFDPGFLEEWDLPGTALAPSTAIEEPDYSKFENWIPDFYRPERPCDYCRSRKLNCYIWRGEADCTPCKSLFRECSLTKSNTLEATNYVDKDNGTFLDTLHCVDETLPAEHGGLTGVKPLKSKGRSSGTSTPVRNDDVPGSSKRNGIRFPRHAVKTLRDWLEAHTDNPYPTEEEKVELERRTELKPNQIANWLANARRRRKASEKTQPRLCQSPSLGPTTAIAIPAPDKPWDELNPLERWKNSPPEHEPASLTDIAHAVIANHDLQDSISASPSTIGRRGKRSSNGSDWSHLRTQSVSSDTGRTSSLSQSNTHGSSHSQSTHGSFGSFSSGLTGKRDRKRKRRPVMLAPGHKSFDDKKRIFQCTFCTDTFKSKYDWTRHEKSLHLSLEKYICAPYGAAPTDEQTGNKKCAYCGCLNPSDEHIETHHHRACDDKGLDARTFFRKDHLRQHMRLMHGCEMTASMDSWRFTSVQINSRCGFCAQRFSMWQERVDHLTAHFKAGARMSEWRGCRGLDPLIAAQVTNAMPPYLIGIESTSLNPFSATNRGSWRQIQPEGEETKPDSSDSLSQNRPPIDSNGSRSTCWELLAVRLGRYAREMANKKEVMTDEMLQAKARRILFDSDDPWNQTAADNPEWLDLFKKAHGLDFIPHAIGGQGSCVPEDLETYGDLGLRIPFAVQLQALNQSQRQKQAATDFNVPGPFKDILDRRRSALRSVLIQLGAEGVLYDTGGKCAHTECAKNVIDVNMINNIDAAEPSLQHWCSHNVSREKAKELANIVSHGFADSPTENESSFATEETCASEECLQDQVDGNAERNPVTDFCELLSSEGTIDPALGAAQARAHGLSALSHAEAPLKGDGLPNDIIPVSRRRLPHHRYKLTGNRARQFATITGAWLESGQMPEPQLTAPPTIDEPFNVSTGAIMEFLGGDMGAALPFSNDAATSIIPLASASHMPPQIQAGELEWPAPELTEQQLDEIIRTTTAEDVAAINAMASAMDTTWMTDDASLVSPAEGMGSADVNMDTAFDDMTFDDVFEMPLDETFTLDV